MSNHKHDNHVVILNPAGFTLYHVGWKLNKLAIMTLELDRKGLFAFLSHGITIRGDTEKQHHAHTPRLRTI